MNRFILCIFNFILLILLAGCGVKEEKRTEATTEVISEESTEVSQESSNIIAEGSGGGDTSGIIENTETVSNEEEIEKLPDVIEPLNNGSACDPLITNASIMYPPDYHREKLLDTLLSYMYKAGIKDDVCTEIHVDEAFSQNTRAYKMTLKFKKNGDIPVSVIWYNDTVYDMQTYVNSDEVGFDSNEMP